MRAINCRESRDIVIASCLRTNENYSWEDWLEKKKRTRAVLFFILEILFRRRRSLEIAFQIAIVKWEDNKNRHFNFPIVIRTNGLRIQTNGDKYQFISLKFNNFI